MSRQNSVVHQKAKLVGHSTAMECIQVWSTGPVYMVNIRVLQRPIFLETT